MIKHSQSTTRRAGLTKTEVLVSAVLLTAVMSVTASMFHNINLVWKNIRHHRIAMGELSDQLDMLTRNPQGDIKAVIKELQPSSICRAALWEPALTASIAKDKLGQRIDVELKWRSTNGTRKSPRSNSVKLSGWLTGGKPK